MVPPRTITSGEAEASTSLLFCAATDRVMRHDRDWREFFGVAEAIEDYPERLAALGALARKRLDADRFFEFCDTQLSDLDEMAYEYFGEQRCRDIIRWKVAALFPEHEVDEFTDHFWGLIQFWRRTEHDRLGMST